MGEEVSLEANASSKRTEQGELKRVRVLVSGRVQGVWFRGSCEQQAIAHKVSGWVRNLPDGCVEAVFEGSPEAVSSMVAWCNIGPPGARVKSVQVKSEPPAGEKGFSIRY
jgi:acylphosphatase